MILILLAIAVIVVVLLAILDDGDAATGVAIFSIIILSIVGFVMMVSYTQTMDTKSEVLAFTESGIYKQYNRIFQSQVNAGVVGDISNVKTGEILITNLQNWYNKIQWVNITIRRHNEYNDSFLWDWFVVDWDKYPPLIDVSQLEKLQLDISKKVENMNGVVPIINIGN